ncbi:hypothetical protein Syun_000910 [Stephania yunnanensis]|uniref:Pre-rRNA-processing protein TSR2 n=1 Tax=Stephania yunnanensis TaxID=152371 RepID=A0AAP0LDU3_9MAGN
MVSGNSGSDAPPPLLNRDCIPLFLEGITLLLSQWTALQMAVENEWGGRDSRNKSQILASDVFTWFTQSKEPLYIDDLERILEECLLLSFNTEAEDGSIEEVAEELMIMHEDFLQGNYEAVDKLRKSSAGPSAVSQSRRLCVESPKELKKISAIATSVGELRFEKQRSFDFKSVVNSRDPRGSLAERSDFRSTLRSTKSKAEKGAVDFHGFSLILDLCFDEADRLSRSTFHVFEEMFVDRSMEFAYSIESLALRLFMCATVFEDDHLGKVVNEDEDGSSDEEEATMDVDELKPRLNQRSSEGSVEHQKTRETADADGWCVVPSRRNRGKKH